MENVLPTELTAFLLKYARPQNLLNAQIICVRKLQMSVKS
jgi:hypothetical protein